MVTLGSARHEVVARDRQPGGAATSVIVTRAGGGGGGACLRWRFCACWSSLGKNSESAAFEIGT